MDRSWWLKGRAVLAGRPEPVTSSALPLAGRTGLRRASLMRFDRDRLSPAARLTACAFSGHDCYLL